MKIVVIGAGPAGMMAAIRAAHRGSSVTLVEKNPSPGKKLLLCGKGRCNLTNACSLDECLPRFSRGGAFLRDAFKAFSNKDLILFFEKRGVRCAIERQQRVFPESGSSADVLRVLLEQIRNLKIDLVTGTAVESIMIHGAEVSGVRCAGRFLPAERVILATGGLSYPGTGSTGDGLAMAQRLGHSAVSPRPGLVPLDTVEKTPALLEGLTLRNIRLAFTAGKHSLRSEIGELVFTGTGVSGPLVLSLSGAVGDMLEEHGPVLLDIDLKPALSLDEVDRRLQRECARSGSRIIKTIMEELVPKRLIGVMLEACGVTGTVKAAALTREQRVAIAAALKGLRFRIRAARSFREAMITRGGISLKEIDPRTMQSRLVKGLYFCGEVIDVDADTGGFNLQAAFSTGYLAGESAAGKKA